jgi:hypothetical protein
LQRVKRLLVFIIVNDILLNLYMSSTFDIIKGHSEIKNPSKYLKLKST